MVVVRRARLRRLVASHEVRAHAAGALPLHVQHVEVDGRTHEIALAPGDDAQLVAARFCGQVGLEPTECNRLAEALRKSQPSRARVQASAGDEASVASSAAAENAEETSQPHGTASSTIRAASARSSVNFRGVLHELYRYDGETLDAALTRFCRRTGAVAMTAPSAGPYREPMAPFRSRVRAERRRLATTRPAGPRTSRERGEPRALPGACRAVVARGDVRAAAAHFHMQQRDEEPGEVRAARNQVKRTKRARARAPCAREFGDVSSF